MGSAVFDFSGQTVLVTGGTKNIGREFAERFARAGASVGVIGGHDADALDDVARSLDAIGNPAAGLISTLDTQAEVDRVVTLVESELGPVDVFVNCAGARFPSSLDGLDQSVWHDAITTNLTVPFLVAQRVMPGMLARRTGRIITLTGLVVHWGGPLSVAGGASKAGLAGLTTSLAAIGATDGVTVNSIMAGYIATDRLEESPERARLVRDRVPMARTGLMSEVASVGLFVASDLASYMTGQTLMVSGGAHPMTGQ